MSRASPRHTPTSGSAVPPSSSSSSSSVPGMNLGPAMQPSGSVQTSAAGRRLLRTPSSSNTGSTSAQAGATPLSAISALPSTTRTAEQLDRVKLDGKIQSAHSTRISEHHDRRQGCGSQWYILIVWYVVVLFVVLVRLGNLLAFPMNQASEASSHFRAEFESIQGESQQELLQSLRMLEFEMEQDDWMYG